MRRRTPLRFLSSELPQGCIGLHPLLSRLFYGQCARVAAGQPGEIEDWAIDIMALLPSGTIYPNRGGRRPCARLEGKRWLSLGSSSARRTGAFAVSWRW